MCSLLSPSAVDSGQHVVQFYERDADLIARAGDYLRDGVRAGAVVIVIASEAHRRGFEERLREGGVDVAAAREEGTLVTLDAAGTLARFSRAGRVDRDAFFDVVGGVVRAAARTGRPVCAYGEMVALLWDAGHVPAAIDLETLWNELATEIRFSLYCAYRSQSVSGHEHGEALARVCHLHSAVVAAAPVDATWHFRPDATAASEARRLLRDALRRAGHAEELVADAQLVVGEFAANAVEHAGSRFTVSLRSTESCVRIEVCDRSAAVPVVRAQPRTTPSGQGMRIVKALATRWGVDSLPDGKVVWAELGAAT